MDAVDLSAATKIPMVNTVVEEGPNGNWPLIADGASKYAVSFYSAAGFIELQPQVNVLLGRTQDWLRIMSDKYAPNCVSNSYIFDGNASLCSANWATVYSYMPTAVTFNGSITSSQDLGLLTLNPTEPYWQALPHEIFHTYQQAHTQAIGTNSDQWPTWFREGSAQAMGYAAYAKFQGGNYLVTLNVEKLYDGNWGKVKCNTGLENLNPVCEYTEGLVAMEYFLSKFGFQGLIDMFSMPGPSSFSARFLSITKMTLEDFYVEVNTYLKSQGWASTWTH